MTRGQGERGRNERDERDSAHDTDDAGQDGRPGEVGSPLLGEGFAQTEDESEHNQYPFAGAVKRRMYG